MITDCEGKIRELDWSSDEIGMDVGNIMGRNDRFGASVQLEGYVKAFEVNVTNTRIVTLMYQHLGGTGIRVQQLWNARMGELLWTHKQQCEYSSESVWFMYPRFSPDGKYVGVYDGRKKIILLNGISPTLGETEIIDLEQLSTYHIEVRIQETRTFAIGLGARRLALAGAHHSPPYLKYSLSASGRLIDSVPMRHTDVSPRIYYTQDGTTLFYLFTTSWSRSQHQIIRFDLTSKSRYPSSEKFTNVSHYTCCGTVLLNCRVDSKKEDYLVLDILF